MMMTSDKAMEPINNAYDITSLNNFMSQVIARQEGHGITDNKVFFKYSTGLAVEENVRQHLFECNFQSGEIIYTTDIVERITDGDGKVSWTEDHVTKSITIIELVALLLDISATLQRDLEHLNLLIEECDNEEE